MSDLSINSFYMTSSPTNFDTGLDELMLSLNSMFAIGNAEDWRFMAVPKNVRKIYKVFGLEAPESGSIILDVNSAHLK